MSMLNVSPERFVSRAQQHFNVDVEDSNETSSNVETDILFVTHLLDQ